MTNNIKDLATRIVQAVQEDLGYFLFMNANECAVASVERILHEYYDKMKESSKEIHKPIS